MRVVPAGSHAIKSTIGPELAKSIIAARPFASLDEISRINGITAERLEQLRLNLTIGDYSPSRQATPQR